MNEAFSQEEHNEEKPLRQFTWDRVKGGSGEDVVVHHGERSEYDSTSLPIDTPDLAKRIKELELQGWKVVKRGAQFIVFEREHEGGQATTH